MVSTLLLLAGDSAVAEGPTGVVARHTFGFSAQEVDVRSIGDYDLLSYRGAESDQARSRIGHPRLPVFTHHFILPPGTKVDDLVVRVRTTSQLEGSYWPLPIQSEEDEFVPPDDEIYGSYEPYPAEPALLTVDGYMQGYHLATLQVWPLQFVGALERILVVTEVEVGASVIPLTAEESARVFAPQRKDWRPWEYRPEVRSLMNHVLNPEGFATFYRPGGTGGFDTPWAMSAVQEERPFGGFRPTEFPSLEGPPVNMVIITDDVRVDGSSISGMTDVFEDLAEWKTSKGIPAVVKTLTWIDTTYSGVDRPEKIRNFVKDAAEKWGTQYVLLGGDLEIVPTRFLGGLGIDPHISLRPDPPGDMYYAELDDNWNQDGNAYFGENELDVSTAALLDLWIGRLPVRDADEAEEVMEKISVYERRPDYTSPAPDTAYYRDVLLAAGPVNGWCSAAGGGDNGVRLAQDIAESLDVANMDILRMYPILPDTAFYCAQAGADVRCFASMLDTVMAGEDPEEALILENLEASLNSGMGYVFHAEHSTRDKLGLLSKEAIKELADCTEHNCDEVWEDSCKTALREFLNDTYPSWADDLTKEVVDDLDNGPAYSVVVSLGCSTNMFDLDCVGEHFIRNPDGGAVAYFGKSSGSGLSGWPVPRNFFGQIFQDDVHCAGMAAALSTNLETESTKAGITWRLLGDPEMPLWTKAPGTLSVSRDPTTFVWLGAQEVEVEVEDADTNDDIEGARVCLKQSDLAYAVAWTNEHGKAVFPAFTPLDDSDTWIVVTADNYKPAKTRIKVSDTGWPHYIAYESHIRDDDTAGGDEDGVLEAGETVEFRVLAENRGNDENEAENVKASLWPTAPIIFDLDITGNNNDEDFEPENIYIGSEGAHPPAVADTFRLPANWEAIRAEEEPEGVITFSSHILIWRDHTARWHLVTKKGPADSDNTFEGILLTEGGFDSVDCAGCAAEEEDSLFFSSNANADSIWFVFSMDAQDDPDSLTFRAEAVNWVSVVTEEIDLGDMGGSDTASGVFEVAWTEKVPDQDEAVFTLAVHDDADSWWFSDFSEIVHSPRVRYLSQQTDTISAGGVCACSLCIWPTISNLGSAYADSVTIELEKIGGSGVVVDDEVIVEDVSPKGIKTATGTFKLCGPSCQAFNDLEYTLFITTHHPNDSLTVLELKHCDILPPDKPTELITDEFGGAVVLRWTAADSSDIEGYHVFAYMPGDTSRLTLEPVVGTTRFEVHGLDTYDAGGSYVDYRYAVTSVDLSGNESDIDEALSDTAHVWLPEVTNWPKKIAGRSECAPKVFDLDGDGDLEILAAGRKIYAWHHNGNPVISGNTDGLFHDPGIVGAVHNFFVGALAISDIDNDDLIEVAGNLAPHSVVVVEFDPDNGGSVSPEWTCRVSAPKTAPIFADLDVDGDLEVLLPGDHWGPPLSGYVYVWTHDGKTFGDPQTTHGRYLQTDSGIGYNYRSLAVAEANADYDGLEIFQSLRSPDDDDPPPPRVVCYSSDDKSVVWRAYIGDDANVRLSTPVLGDVDGDGGGEVVVARQTTYTPGPVSVDIQGGIWVLDDSTGAKEDSVLCDAFHFVGKPPHAPALASVDGSSNLEIFAGGGYKAMHYSEAYSKILRAHVLFEDGMGDLDTLTVDDGIMIPGRKWRDTATSSQPVVGDLDGDDRLEVLVPIDAGYLACFEWDDANQTARAERGWPQLFEDVPMTPVLADVDGEGKLELVVQDKAGWVHVFQMPGDGGQAHLPWREYAHDSRNTSNAAASVGGRAGRRPPEIGDQGAGGAPLTVGPNPLTEPIAWLYFGLEREEPIRLEMFDLQGRLVAMLVDEVLPAGNYRIAWDGNDDRGARVGSGIYFMKLKRPGGSEVRKVSVIR
jgi:hypothetical protein